MNDNPYFHTHAEDYAEQIMTIQPELYQNIVTFMRLIDYVS